MKVTATGAVPSVVDPVHALAVELHNIKQSRYDPSLKDFKDKSLVKYSLLAVTDDFLYTGSEFEHRKVRVPVLVKCSLGEEVFTIELSEY